MKKTLVMVVAIVLIAALAIGGTFAYLQDTDSDVNVAKVGNVDIEQHEKQANGSDFVQGKAFYPGTTLEKVVTVENVGISDAYIRTWFAFEQGSLTKEALLADIAIDKNESAETWVWDEVGTKEIGDSKYYVMTATYPEALAPAAETEASLIDVMLKTTATNEDVIGFDGNKNGTYDILVFSQAVQKENFTDAKTALNTAFGEEHPWENVVIPIVVSNAEELSSVLNEVKTRAKEKIPGTNGIKTYREEIAIVLNEDIVVDGDTEFMYTDGNGAAFHFYGVKGTIDLNGHDIIVESDALLAGKDNANALFLFQYSDVDIVGDGSVIANNKSIPVYGWANGTVNIYGGTYITNASERNESAIYVNNASMFINVYGGNFEGSEYAFNVHDNNCGNTPVIVLHEGVSCKKFMKNNTTDVFKRDKNAGRIVPADGCALEETEIDGEAWYKVVKSSL